MVLCAAAAALMGGTPLPAFADDSLAVPMPTASPTPMTATPPSVRLDVKGLQRVDIQVLRELLPRELPTSFTTGEVDEIQRRLWSLGIFDHVEVATDGEALVIVVREKWTLIPGADLAIARTLRDSFFLLSLTESNLFGRAQTLRAYGFYAERNFGGEVAWLEHESAARRLSFEAAAAYYGSSVFFLDTPTSWTFTRAGAGIGLRLPFGYARQWRFALLASGYRETSTEGLPVELPRRGGYAGFGARLAWDGLEVHDIAPRGFRWTAEILPGLFWAPRRIDHRHAATMQAIGAIRMTPTVALLLNAVVEAVNPGSVNHSYLLGNLRGVRGLPDNLYRDVAHAFVNAEWRFATQLAPRWFVQGALLLDAGAHSHMNEASAPMPIAGAISAGVGVRIIPTLLVDVVPRVDIGSLLLPERAWYVNFGISQYF